MNRPQNPNELVRRRGRTAAIAVFFAITTVFTVVCSAEIIVQVWWPEISGPAPECRPELAKLFDSVPAARKAAAEGPGGEKAAIDRFRRALRPAWASRPALTGACAGDQEAAQALRAVDALRYAEENHVRHEAAELTRRRRDAAKFRQKLFDQP